MREGLEREGEKRRNAQVNKKRKVLYLGKTAIANEQKQKQNDLVMGKMCWRVPTKEMPLKMHAKKRSRGEKSND